MARIEEIHSLCRFGRRPKETSPGVGACSSAWSATCRSTAAGGLGLRRNRRMWVRSRFAGDSGETLGPQLQSPATTRSTEVLADCQTAGDGFIDRAHRGERVRSFPLRPRQFPTEGHRVHCLLRCSAKLRDEGQSTQAVPPTARRAAPALSLPRRPFRRGRRTRRRDPSCLRAECPSTYRSAGRSSTRQARVSRRRTSPSS